MTMTESPDIDSITQQARQGSVAAIIQILNDRLADCGVRTRAILAQGILQLLCEADTTERLEQDSLVQQIRQILASLRPRHIRRVKINSRLVKEQQLLWLDEIKRDPEGQLLWTAEISLPRANPIQLLVEDLISAQKQADRVVVNPSTSRKARDRRQFARGIIGGAGVSLGILLLGWGVYDWVGNRTGSRDQSQVSGIETRESGVADTSAFLTESAATTSPSISTNSASADLTSPESLSSSTTTQPDSASDVSEASDDPFAQAVWLAQQAVTDGQVASTSAEWLELASRWQRASDLMGQVSADDERYATAQDRQLLYQANSDEALTQADLHQAQ